MTQRKRTIPKWKILQQAIARRRLNLECDGILYKFAPVSIRRLKNWILDEASSQLRLARPLALPTHLQVEPTNRCNLRCIVCPVTTGEMSRPKGSMDVASFQGLMNEIGDSLLLLLLWEWGEPFLNGDLCQLIAAAKSHGIKVVTSTNGHAIQDSSKAREIIASGLDTLVFAIDGATPETYRVYRQGGQFERVVESARLVVDAKRSTGAKSPLLVLQFIVMRHNEAQIAGAVDLAKDLGIDVLTLRTANPYHGDFEETALPNDQRFRQFEYVEGSYERKRRPNSCKRFWNNPAVQWNGSVAHCEYDVDGEYALGNAFASSFRSIWLGDRYEAARRAFAARRPITRPCLHCMYNFSSVHDIVARVIPLSDAARSIGVR